MSEMIPRQRVLDGPEQESSRDRVDEATLDQPRPLVTPPPKPEAAAPREAVRNPGPSTSRTEARSAAAADFADEKTPLLSAQEGTEMRSRWDRIQTEFIDQPRKSVEEANALVADTMARLTAVFSQERQKLERQWDRKEDVSTEELRQALRRYRSFFSRLLTV